MKKYKSHLLFVGLVAVFAGFMFIAGEIILPFLLAFALAIPANAIVRKIQKVIKNRVVAVTTFLLGVCLLIIGGSTIFGALIKHDFHRFHHAFEVFSEKNSESIDASTKKIKSYIEVFYSEVEKGVNDELKPKFDSIQLDSLQFDSEMIQSSLSKVTSFFSSGEKKEESKSYNWLFIFFEMIGYFITIIYTYSYFESRMDRYAGSKAFENKYLKGILSDFNRTFVGYFKQRSKIALICAAIFIVSFLLIGVPGAILLGVLAGVLCLIPNFHYFALIPLSFCCLAESIEYGNSFFIYFGLVVFVMILITILESEVFFPKIMKSVSGMNPAIIALSIALWSSLLGVIGFFIALPLTSILFIYLDRALRYDTKEEENTVK